MPKPMEKKKKSPKVFPKPLILKDLSMRGWLVEVMAIGSSEKQEETI